MQERSEISDPAVPRWSSRSCFQSSRTFSAQASSAQPPSLHSGALAHSSGAHCGGAEITAETHTALVTELDSDRTVDLTGPGFSALTDAGFAELAEIPGLCATMEAVFLGPYSAISAAALESLKAGCHQGKCFELGREISKSTFLRIKTQVSEASLDLSGPDFERLTEAGLLELVHAFPDTEKLLAAAETVKLELRAKLVKAVTALIRDKMDAPANSEPEAESLTPRSGMKLNEFVALIKEEMGLEGKMAPKEVIAAAADEYGVQVGGF